MTDRQKVIKGLTECVAAGLEKACSADCPYFLKCFPDVGLATPFMSLMADALALLKEPEAVKPDMDSEGTCSCGNCGETVGWFPDGCSTPKKLCKFCPECGRAVKWE